MATLSYAEIDAHHPDVLLPPDVEFLDDYSVLSRVGRDLCRNRRVAFVAICRNAMPFLPYTLASVRRIGESCKEWKAFVFENDSTDDTKDYLRSWADGRTAFCETVTLDRPHLNFTKETRRTVPLAEYRNHCRRWVDSHAADFDLVVVFDTDPWGGFSVNGVYDTIGRLATVEHDDTAGMASYSWCEWGPPMFPARACCHYDAFAFRWTWWKERQDMLWFHLWHPPVGSPPIRVNSAFGQLAVYRTKNFLRGVYDGSDCEHVGFHRSMGGALFLNPAMRCVSFWIPEGARMPDGSTTDGGDLHGDVHSNVGGRDADASDRGHAQDLG